MSSASGRFGLDLEKPDSTMSSATRHRILIVQPLPGIGDMVWHLPHIHAVARIAPEGKVCVLTKPRSASNRLLKSDSNVSCVFWVERNPGCHDGLQGFFRLVGLLRRERFSQVWIFHHSLRYALAALLAGIPQRIGYGFGLQRLLLNAPVRLAENYRHDHPIVKADQLLVMMGVTKVEDEPKLSVSIEASRLIAARFGAIPEPWIALGIGSSEPVKQWGEAKFAELALALNRRKAGSLFIVGGAAERHLADAIIGRVRCGGGIVIDAVGLPIEQTAALLARCRCYVGNDTGVLNMAASLQVPSLGLFGGSKPLRYSRFIYPILPVPADGGMQAISVDRVLVSLKGLI